MLRVLQIGKYYAPFQGGMEVFLKELVDSLAARGVSSEILVHDHEPARGRRRTPGDGRTPEVGPEGQTLTRAPILGTVAFAPISPTFPLLLRNLCRSFEPQVIHFHMPNLSAFWALAIPCCRNTRWLVHWHSDVVASRHSWKLRLLYPIYRPFEQLLLRRADAVVATSREYLESSRALAKWKHKCHVIPLGLDAKKLPAPTPEERAWASRQWRDSANKVLFIGRFTYYKAVEDLVRAATRLDRATVCLVGSGEEETSLRALASAQGVGDSVRFLGRCSAGRKAALLETCDCLCLPSIERTEAFGVVLLEAMAYGKPAISCRIPGSGVGAVIEDGRSGVLVPMRSPEALATAIRAVCDPERNFNMGRHARKRFETEFSVAEVSSRISDLYEKILD